MAFDIDKAAKLTGSRMLAKAELEALKSEEEVLSAQLREYDTLRSGAVTVLEADSLAELPSILIRARIARGLSQRQLANKLKLKEQQIQRYESDKYASANLCRLTEIAAALGLSIRKVAELKQHYPIQDRNTKEGIEWDKFPVKEMYKRNWFEGFTGSMADAMTRQTELARDFVHGVMPRRQPAFLRHRVRHGSHMDQYALWAWQCRVLMLAKKTPPGNSYLRDVITEDWLRSLAHKSCSDDGPRQAKRQLAQAGISLVIEAHLPQTYLDGAAFLLPNGNPVIGMTLRHDRLDNFWFVLFHELIHVIKHLRKGKLEDIFDDLDAEPDDVEREANALASNALIPDSTWEVSLARYVRTEESIEELAKGLQIHASIVAGRIRKEAGNYVILSSMVGNGKVRCQFSEASFAQ